MQPLIKEDYKDQIGDYTLRVQYRIDSSLTAIENERYVQKIHCTLGLENEVGFIEKNVGSAYIEKLLIIEGYENEWPAYTVFDTSQVLEDLGKTIFNFKKQDFVKPIRKFYKDGILDRNVLYLNTIEILPEFRGLKIGEHLIKDIANNFLTGCGLFVVDSRPMQFLIEPESEEYKLMRYDKFEQDEEKAKERLRQYFRKTGFDYIPEASDDYLFYSPYNKNVNFDYIELE